MKKVKGKPQLRDRVYRNAVITASENDSSGIYELSVSSEQPYLRTYGYEVLGHDAENVILDRLLNGAPVLTDHETWNQVGVVEKAWLQDGKLRAHIRFSKSVKGQEVEQDIIDRIRRNVSVGYDIHDVVREPDKDGYPVYRAVKWEPMEISIVSVPADITVGVGRSAKKGKREGDLILIYDEENTVVEIVLEDGTSVTDPDAIAQILADVETDADVEVQAGENESVSESTEDEVEDEENKEDEVEELQETSEDGSENEQNEEKEDETIETELVNNDDVSDEENDKKRNTIVLVENSRMKNNLDKVSNPVRLTDKEQKQYSIARAILNATEGKRSGFEFEISDDIAKRTGKDTSGFYMPTSVRAMTIADGASAGAYTFTQGGEFIDYLRNRAVVAQLGATVVTLSQKTALPRQTSDLTAQWIAEDGSGATFVSASYDQVLMSPRKLSTATAVSKEALTVASLDTEALVINNIYSSFAVAFDNAAIQGAGGNAPTGLLSLTGLVSGSNSGSVLTWGGAVALQKLVAEANADFGSLAYLSTVGVKTTAMTTIKSGSTASFICEDDKIGVYNAAHSNNVPNLAGGGVLIFGDWSSVILANFGAIEIIVDPYSQKHKGLLEIAGTMLGDVGFKHVRSFAIQKGLTVL